MKLLKKCENPSSNPLQEACSGFPLASSDSQSCSKSHTWSWKLFWKPAINFHRWKSRPMREKESRNRNLMQLFEQSSGRLGSVFKGPSRNLKIIFLFKQAGLKFKNHFRMYKKYCFNFMDITQIFIWWPNLFNLLTYVNCAHVNRIHIDFLVMHIHSLCREEAVCDHWKPPFLQQHWLARKIAISVSLKTKECNFFSAKCMYRTVYEQLKIKNADTFDCPTVVVFFRWSQRKCRCCLQLCITTLTWVRTD